MMRITIWSQYTHFNYNQCGVYWRRQTLNTPFSGYTLHICVYKKYYALASCFVPLWTVFNSNYLRLNVALIKSIQFWTESIRFKISAETNVINIVFIFLSIFRWMSTVTHKYLVAFYSHCSFKIHDYNGRKLCIKIIKFSYLWVDVDGCRHKIGQKSMPIQVKWASK